MSLLATQRRLFHTKLLANVLTLDDKGVASNADSSQITSKLLARGIYDLLIAEQGNHVAQPQARYAGQTSGNRFELEVERFLSNTFSALSALRPGLWEVQKIAARSQLAIADYEQYRHLAELEQLTKNNATLATVLGNDYTISPDVIVLRNLEEDSDINSAQAIVDAEVSRLASLRKSNGGKPLLHATISCKWTIRSDRAQNSRSEALNLIRNRKGHTPHIVVVTGEPTPSRLASIALGTGDLDCVYHFALYELQQTLTDMASAGDGRYDDTLNMLNIMIDGRRLKDISDLPLDLAV
jgi:hypothetical protein